MARLKELPTSSEGILKLIADRELTADAYVRLQQQFEADQDILHREKQEVGKPDVRTVNNFPGYITTVNVGYFIGKPVSYKTTNAPMMEALQDIFDYNDEQDTNVQVAKKASIAGVGYELLYTDADASCRFAKVDPEEILVIKDMTLEANIIGAIRYITDADKNMLVELYDKEKVISYEKGKDDTDLRQTRIEQHHFEDVPVVEYLNNDEKQGDFEKTLTLINEYDKSQSETGNDFEYFGDAYMVIRNMGDVDEDAIAKAKRNRVLLLPNEGEVSWLIKNIQDAALEHYKERLANDIHKFSMTPNLTDEAFAQNLSGVALEFKLWGLEQLAAQKERGFKKGLQRRIELILNWLGKRQAKDYDWRDIEIVFTRNIPKNLVDIVKMVTELIGQVSWETRISMLPGIESAAKERELLEQEMAGNIDLDRIPKIEKPEPEEEPDPDEMVETE